MRRIGRLVIDALLTDSGWGLLTFCGGVGVIAAILGQLRTEEAVAVCGLLLIGVGGSISHRLTVEDGAEATAHTAAAPIATALVTAGLVMSVGGAFMALTA